VVNQISKTDVTDNEFLDQEELESDGTFSYLTAAVVSTTAGTHRVVISLPADGEGILTGRDHPVEPGDFVIITGTSGGSANGRFTVSTVAELYFSVSETIATTTGGSVNFYHRAGAARIGINPDGLHVVTSNNVQHAIEQLDAAFGGGTAITAADHKIIRELIHLADEGGPFEGFPSGVYQETLPPGSLFPTSVIWWGSAAKTIKIVEETITWNPNHTMATETWKVYASDGYTLLAEVTDAITYSGLFELHRTRTIADYGLSVSDTFTLDEHKTIRQLVHLAAEGGPYEGFTSGAFQETLPPADAFPTSVIWWTSSAKTAKIVEETLTYNDSYLVATDEWKGYADDGTTVLTTVTDMITYSGIFELYRTRVIT
jgi:hypothetical protein